jgi:hypothetical protein
VQTGANLVEDAIPHAHARYSLCIGVAGCDRSWIILRFLIFRWWVRGRRRERAPCRNLVRVPGGEELHERIKIVILEELEELRDQMRHLQGKTRNG